MAFCPFTYTHLRLFHPNICSKKTLTLHIFYRTNTTVDNSTYIAFYHLNIEIYARTNHCWSVDIYTVWLVSLVWPIPLHPVDFSIKIFDVMLFPPTWPTLHNKQHDQRHTLKLSPDHEIPLTTTCHQHRNSPASLCIWLQHILETSFAAFGWAVKAKWRLWH